MNFSKNKYLIGFFAMIIAVAITVTFCFAALSQAVSEAHRLTVVIDAGHGGIDGGVTGHSGVKESDINLSVAQCLQQELEEVGFFVVMTRKTEAGLYGIATKGFKKRDMQRRAQVIRESMPALVLSVHQNFFSSEERRGAQVFYREGAEASKQLACSIQAALNAMPDCVRESAPLAGDYYVLNCNDFPAVIVECCFLSNREDEALITDREYQLRMAQTIAAGAIAFLSSSAGNR